MEDLRLGLARLIRTPGGAFAGTLHWSPLPDPARGGDGAAAHRCRSGTALSGCRDPGAVGGDQTTRDLGPVHQLPSLHGLPEPGELRRFHFLREGHRTDRVGRGARRSVLATTRQTMVLGAGGPLAHTDDLLDLPACRKRAPGAGPTPALTPSP